MNLLDFIFKSNKSRTQIGALRLSLLTSEGIKFEGGVTKYPVEDGSEISDHIKMGPITLDISGEIAATESYLFRDEKTSFIDALELMEKMHQERAEITIVTGLRQYEHMGTEMLEAERGVDGNWLKIKARFSKIRKVSSKTAQVQEQQTTGPTRGRAGQTATRNPQNSTDTGQSGNSTDDPRGTSTLGRVNFDYRSPVQSGLPVIRRAFGG